jgi:hypothetical protein
MLFQQLVCERSNGNGGGGTFKIGSRSDAKWETWWMPTVMRLISSAGRGARARQNSCQVLGNGNGAMSHKQIQGEKK